VCYPAAREDEFVDRITKRVMDEYKVKYEE
jgi:hypothetical protein